MVEFLIHRFIKEPDQIHDRSVRLAYGILSSVTGIVCNIFLFILKGTIGLLIHSVSIISDGFNNLTDCISCIVTLFGFRMASRPADREHPFGHGRMEYIVSLFAAILIFMVAFELAKNSFLAVVSPSPVTFDLYLFIILCASILVKVWMAHFYRTLGKKTDNLAMMASAEDSRNDVLATSISLAAMLFSVLFPKIPFDGIAGLILSCFIFWSGVGIVREIIDRLLGPQEDPVLYKDMKEVMLKHPEILGVHDLMVHDYGPGVQIASAHVEMDSRMSLLEAHAVCDKAEQEIADAFHVVITLHIDPVVENDTETAGYEKLVKDILAEIDDKLSLHDFRLIHNAETVSLVYDIELPFDLKMSNEALETEIAKRLKEKGKHVKMHIHFDRGFITEEN